MRLQCVRPTNCGCEWAGQRRDEHHEEKAPSVQQVQQRVEQHLLVSAAELVHLLDDDHHRPAGLVALLQLGLQGAHVAQEVGRAGTGQELLGGTEQSAEVLAEDRPPHSGETDGRAVSAERLPQRGGLALDGLSRRDGDQRAAHALPESLVHRLPHPSDDMLALPPELAADRPLHLRVSSEIK